MEEIEQLKKQNADLLLAVQQARNTALEEAALVCDRASEPGHKETASAIRSLKNGISGAAGTGEPADVWAAKGMTVRDVGNGDLYVVLEPAQAWISEQWREAVMYRPAGDSRVLVLEAGQFSAGFEPAEGDTAAGTCAAGLPGDWQPVMDEVGRATRKFPTWPTDPLHAVAILGEEFGELTKAVLQTIYEPHKVQEGELRTEAVQTAAMALRFLASLERYSFAPSSQHAQS